MTKNDRKNLIKHLQVVAEHCPEASAEIVYKACAELSRLHDADHRAFKATSRLTAIKKLIAEAEE